jgi:hypothetical protein
MEERICVEIKVSIDDRERIGIENITEAVKRAELDKAVTKEIIEALQDSLVEEMCGARYERNREYTRATTKNRTIGTIFGKITFPLKKIRDKRTGKIRAPIAERIDFNGKKRYQKDISWACIDLSTKLTYRDCRREAELFVPDVPSPRTICRRVQEISIEKENEEKADLIMADGTKAHGLGKKREVRVVIGLKDGEKRLLSCRVDKPWDEIADEIAGDIAEETYLTGDAERDLLILIRNERDFQLCLNHCLRYTGYALWKDRVDKDEKRGILKDLARILFTMRNSVLKHMKDMEAIKQRMDWAVKEIMELYRRVKELSLSTARFIRRASNQVVTFARVYCEKGRIIPWNNNQIERLMGELSKRIKHKWMHWSDHGLEAISNLILIRYCERRRWNRLRDRYVSRERNRYISIDSITVRSVWGEF